MADFDETKEEASLASLFDGAGAGGLKAACVLVKQPGKFEEMRTYWLKMEGGTVGARVKNALERVGDDCPHIRPTYIEARIVKDGAKESVTLLFSLFQLFQAQDMERNLALMQAQMNGRHGAGGGWNHVKAT